MKRKRILYGITVREQKLHTAFNEQQQWSPPSITFSEKHFPANATNQAQMLKFQRLVDK